MQGELVGENPVSSPSWPGTLKMMIFQTSNCFRAKSVNSCWSLTLGERYFKILSVEWFKSQALVKQRAGEFNSFSLSHERPFCMKIRKIMKVIIFEPLELDFRSCVIPKVIRRAFKL